MTKRFLIILALGLLTSCGGTQNYGLGDSNKVEIYYSDADVIIFSTYAGGYASYIANAMRQELKMGIQHCSSHNKKLYAFKGGPDATSSIEMSLNRGYDHVGPSDFSWHHRYFCANDLKLAMKLMKEKKIPKLGDWYVAYNDPSLFTHYEVDGSSPIALAKKTEPKTTEPSPDDNKVVAAASGTGFFVSNTGHIVTNHHVIDECKAVKVNYKGNEIEAKVLAIDKTNDLAILEANINPEKVYAVSNKDVALLEDVIVAGFPLGKKVSSAIKTHKGSVTALAGFGDNYSNFQTDATINQGNSGGPVMDQKGNIVGVAVALMSAEAGQNIFFAVKSSTLKTFANANGITFLPPNNREMSNAELGQLITEATVFLECWMTIAKIKQIIAQEENRKAFYSEFK